MKTLQTLSWTMWKLDGIGAYKTGYLRYLDPIPFEVRRVFWIAEWAPGQRRGGHAHRRCHQLFIPTAGWVNFLLTDPVGGLTDNIIVSAPSEALWVKPMVWLEMMAAEKSIPDTRLLCLCSEPYDESEYIRTRPGWERLRQERRDA